MTSVASQSRSVSAEGADGPATLAHSTLERLRLTFADGRTRTLQWRLAQLEGLARLLNENEDAIVAALDSDLGRPPADAWLADIAAVLAEIKTARSGLKKWMSDTTVRLPLMQAPGRGRVHREPQGIVLIIGPWNYPLYLTLGPLVGALAAGNCAVVKPSEFAPRSSALLAELLPRYIDRDAVQVVEGGVPETSALIAARVDHIFFTGSPAVGKRIMAAAAPHLTPVTLELGGKSPVIVDDHADIAVAARRIVWAKLMNSGQTCITPDYILATDKVADKLTRAIVRTLKSFRPQPDPGLRIVDSRQFDRLLGLLNGHNGQIVHGGGTSREGLTIEPTVILDPDPDSEVMQEEIFGPILPIVTVKDLSAAIDFINAREKPLAAYLFSGSRTAADRVVAETSSGGVVINHIGLHCMAPNLPFGGVGNSGMGAYHGRWGYETMSHRKAVVTTSTRPDPPLLYPPARTWKQRILRRFF
ncbi:aldehyde dehydrogenase family protein [Gordonia jinghuaiqii]